MIDRTDDDAPPSQPQNEGRGFLLPAGNPAIRVALRVQIATAGSARRNSGDSTLGASHSLLDRVLSERDMDDDVNQYVIVLCAQQLCQEIRRDYAQFWQDHAADAGELVGRISAGVSAIRQRLIEHQPDELPAFLDWFERWFLKRAQPVETHA